jgi:3-hydroxyisobutyrate dehydrogenase-like beta-hydroxyacid dehydrogenase
MERPIGLIGLGMLGTIFAGHLARDGRRVVAHDRDAGRTHPGVERVADVTAVARSCNVIVLSLPDPPAVDAVMAEILAAAGPGTVVVDTSTIDPPTARRSHAAAAAGGVGYIEAPISGGEPLEGGTDGARAASVTFMVGGEAPDLARAEPVLRLLGRHIFHLGPAGSGAEVKLISNMCSGAYALVTAEAFAAGAALGIAPERLVEVFRHTDAKSYFMTDYLLPRLVGDRYDDGFAVRLQLKDHRLFGAMADELGIATPVNDLATATYEAALADDGDRDVTAVVERAISRARPSDGRARPA